MRLQNPKYSFTTGSPLIEDDADALNLAVYALRKIKSANGNADEEAPAIADALACLAIIDAAAMPWRCDNCHRSNEGIKRHCRNCGRARP